MATVRRKPSIETTVRLIRILTLLPRAPGKLETKEIRERLEATGIDVDLRTVQRDLSRLSVHFPIVTDDARPSGGWSWARSAPEVMAPMLEPKDALVYHLMERYLVDLVPRPMLESLRPRFEAAWDVLRSTPLAKLRQWQERVVALPRGMPLIPAKVNAEAVSVVYEAMLERRQFEVEYLAAGKERSKTYDVSPIGIVVRGAVSYVIVAYFNYPDPRQLALHRIVKARLLDKPAIERPDFSMADYIASGELDWPVGPVIDLVLNVDADVARHLGETRISVDQTLEPARGGTVLLKARVQDTLELHRWIRSFGEDVRVVSPASLKRKL